MRWSSSIFTAAVLFTPWVLPFSAQAQIKYTPIVISGQQAADMPAGVTYSLFDDFREAGGHYVFTSVVSGGGKPFDGGLWTGGPGAFQLQIRYLQPIPGLSDDAKWGGITPFTLNRQGDVAFAGWPTRDGLSSNGFCLWAGTPSNPRLVARKGASAPGTSTTFRDFDDELPLGPSGDVAFRAELADGTRGIWAGKPDSLRLVARTGDPVPGYANGVKWDGMWNSPVFTHDDQVIFTADLRGPGITLDNRQTVWSASGGTLRPILRSGDPAPGTNAQYGGFPTAFGPFWTADAGPHMAYLAGLTGPTVNTANNSGLWLRSGEHTQLVVRRGDRLPGTPQGTQFTFSIFMEGPAVPFFVDLNDAGQIVFSGALSGSAVTAANNQGIWAGDPDHLHFIARTGDQVPGLDEGILFGQFIWSPAISPSGQVAFLANLTGPGVDAATNSSLWTTTPDGELLLVARGGDWIDLAPGDRRQIAYVNGNSYRHWQFDDQNQLLFSVAFTDGSKAILAAQVPEPASLALLLLPTLTLLRRPRQIHP